MYESHKVHRQNDVERMNTAAVTLWARSDSHQKGLQCGTGWSSAVEATAGNPSILAVLHLNTGGGTFVATGCKEDTRKKRQPAVLNTRQLLL